MPLDRVRLIAAVKQRYENRTLCPNDEFETDELEALDLIAMGYARRATDDDPKRRAGYKRRDLRAE